MAGGGSIRSLSAHEVFALCVPMDNALGRCMELKSIHRSNQLDAVRIGSEAPYSIGLVSREPQKPRGGPLRQRSINQHHFRFWPVIYELTICQHVPPDQCKDTRVRWDHRYRLYRHPLGRSS